MADGAFLPTFVLPFAVYSCPNPFPIAYPFSDVVQACLPFICPYRFGAMATRVGTLFRARTSTFSVSIPHSPSPASTLKSFGIGVCAYMETLLKMSRGGSWCTRRWLAPLPALPPPDVRRSQASLCRHVSAALRWRVRTPQLCVDLALLSPRYGAPLIIFDLVRQTERRPRETILGRGLAEAIHSIQVRLPLLS